MKEQYNNYTQPELNLELTGVQESPTSINETEYPQLLNIPLRSKDKNWFELTASELTRNARQTWKHLLNFDKSPIAKASKGALNYTKQSFEEAGDLVKYGVEEIRTHPQITQALKYGAESIEEVVDIGKGFVDQSTKNLTRKEEESDFMKSNLSSIKSDSSNYLNFKDFTFGTLNGIDTDPGNLVESQFTDYFNSNALNPQLSQVEFDKFVKQQTQNIGSASVEQLVAENGLERHVEKGTGIIRYTPAEL